MKILSIFGTRPEVIKMAPIIMALKNTPNIENIVCATSQHRQMQDMMLPIFNIIPDYDLNIMRSGQDLAYITAEVLQQLSPILYKVKPDYVLVHGDTTTSFAATLAAFYQQIKVGHVEAGLRTYDLLRPFPEEANRQLTSRLAQVHFAPTNLARTNLLKDLIDDDRIFITGNTIIDALLWAKANLNLDRVKNSIPHNIVYICDTGLPYVLITGHRRENFGGGFASICAAIKRLSEAKPDWHFIYPVHLNPQVKIPVSEMLGDLANVHLIQPVEYEAFIYLMMHCKIILTDSGGIQEEGPSLGKPVLVMRDKTERPEGVVAGTTLLVGTNVDNIRQNVLQLMDCSKTYTQMTNKTNPYGDGHAATKIVNILTGLT